MEDLGCFKLANLILPLSVSKKSRSMMSTLSKSVERLRFGIGIGGESL